MRSRPPLPPLPIDAVLPPLRDALRASRNVVLQAPPGAGKTTYVPLALLDEPWLAGQRLVMLEPRRLAARAAAQRMAQLLGERAGETVGYRMRLDTRVGPDTRIEVVTEGVLTRMLQQDATLEGVGALVFDEFHERSLAADLGLALALETQALVREELRLLVMSATLDGTAVARLLAGDGARADVVPVVTSEGRSFPVETRWSPARPERVEPAVAAAVQQALRDSADHGDVLVFLPGVAEIRRVEELLAARLPAATSAGDPSAGSGQAAVRVLPLHGTLPQAAQDEAIAPSRAGVRKVVLSTSIAETSLTIDGVRIVVDCGLSRVPRFDARSGMTRLETVRVSRAAADQRRGRAGRLGPGVCYRLWPEHEHHHLLSHDRPEILEADLAPLALDLAAAGVADPSALRWLDAPPAAAYAQARELLAQLGAVDDAGRLTAHGTRMAELPMHPRLAHMVLSALPLRLGRLACELAALLGERDLLRREGPGEPPDADVRLRLPLVRGESAPAFAAGAAVDRGTLHRVRQQAREWAVRLRVERERGDADDEQAGLLLAFAYPDRIAQRRADDADAPGASAARYLLRNGRGAVLGGAQSLVRAPLLVAAQLDGRQRESRIFLAAPLSIEELEAHFGGQLATERVVAWDDGASAVLARERERLGALVLRDVPLRAPDPDEVAAALLEGVSRRGVSALPWSDAARALRQRLAFLRALDGEWPDVSDEALAATMDAWLAPHLYGLRRLDDVARVDLHALLLALLPPAKRAALNALAPTHLVVPSGSRVPIDYADPAAPVLAVRLQELFGLAETPRLARGAVPVTLHLLSPAHRPVQVTRDLAGFWRTSYFDVRKEMRGRYPKHHWPDDPMEATPTSRAKRRGE